MPVASIPRVPKYRRHKPSGQAVVTLSGREIYLGPWNSKASKREYERLLGEWLAGGRRWPATGAASETLVVELIQAYWRFAQGYYQKNGQPTKSLLRVKVALRMLRQVYGPTRAGEFGPLALQALQQKFVAEGKCRRYTNYLVEEIKRVFKWGVSREMIPPAVFHALATVPGLRKGRSEAREPEPIGPVAPALVDATLPYLPPVVADMVRFQRLAGCRPGEVCAMRPCDINRSGEVWEYRPEHHKTEHHGRERVIFIGPQAQAVLLPYLLRDAEAHCFVPGESERKRLEYRHAARVTPLSCGNVPGSNRKRRCKRRAGKHYTNGAYANCVRRACDIADREAHRADPSIKAEVRIVPRWTPNQLRHAVATEVRKRFGLEAVQVVLGHARADVSQIYAERDNGKAAAIMREVG